MAAADGVLFACPEYNGSVSGPLKNAIDWASRSPNVWDNKPVAMMGAGGGSGTAKAQLHLREIAVVVNALMLNKTVQVQARVPFAASCLCHVVAASCCGCSLANADAYMARRRTRPATATWRPGSW